MSIRGGTPLRRTFVQTTLFVHVGLCLGGLDYMNIAPPGGGEQLKLTGAAAPFLTMIPPGRPASTSGSGANAKTG